MSRTLGVHLALLLPLASPVWADVKLPAIFGSHMVLQQGRPIRVWGRADPGEEVVVSIAEREGKATAGDDGKWKAQLEALSAGGPHVMKVQGKNSLELEDVLIGEVWVCSGQSNMQWPLKASTDADLELAASDYPRIRLITVPQVGSQEPQEEFKGQWEACGPQTVGEFSAVGYFFGRQIHRTLGVPVGLIDNSWGGSACEAWIPTATLAADERYKPLLERWAEIERAKPDAPELGRGGNHRPANLWNGALHPIIGYGIRGAIWYQGESNAGRAYQYRHLFPLMIKTWREGWGQGDFPFYWVQLADFKAEKAEPGESDWAELREAQTMTLSALPNTGEAVIIDVGEGRDIHPRNKLAVGLRLSRWALARDYGKSIACRSPSFQSAERQGEKMVLRFDHVGSGLYSFDVGEPKGFAIAGADKKWVWARAKITGKDTVEVWAEGLAEPVAARYAWADNPVCTLFSRDGLPATPFRTDDWPGLTINHLR